jgi:drug/metabolite transporter (DMT)-like permease
MHPGVIYALLAAVLFGASTPFAKTLVGQMPPVTLAAILYLGSGIGLLACYGVRALVKRGAQSQPTALTRADLPWFAGAVAAGGVAGPLLLMLGLRSVSASTASLLLNLEGVLTSLLAWLVFRENVDRRIFTGMLLIVAAGVLLSIDQAPVSGLPWGAMAIVGACLCWGIDNNLTRKVAASDPLQIAATKGLVAGAVNLAIGLGLGGVLPEVRTVLVAGVVGFCGYGLSLVLFVLALRHLGTARTGAYFSAAPFAGAALSLVMFGDVPGTSFWIGAALMAGGIWLHLTESHGHEHTHEALAHGHAHTHDAHHQHAHDFAWDGVEPHVHPHQHVPLTHEHPHYPDIHHRHEH